MRRVCTAALAVLFIVTFLFQAEPQGKSPGGKPGEVSSPEKPDAKRAEYEEKLKKAKTANDFYNLGRWCEKNDLEEEAKQAYEKAIKLNPNHRNARKKLGYVKRKGEWVKKNGHLKSSKKKPKGTRECALRALEYLLKSQRKDGSWSGGKITFDSGKVALASICGLALMASGKDRYRASTKRALEYVVGNIEKVYTSRSPKSNWALAFAVMFLAEEYSAHKNKAIRTKLKAVARGILENQESSGGWAHGPGFKTAHYLEFEIMSNWCLSAVGMARQLKIKLDKAKIGKGLEYVIRHIRPDGGMHYSLNNRQTSVARTGGAIFTFSMLKQQSHPKFQKMVSFFQDKMDRSLESAHGSPAMCLFQSAIAALQLHKTLWDKYVEVFFEKILGKQKSDGSFGTIPGEKGQDFDSECGTAYNTAFYALILLLDEGNLRFFSGKYAKDKK